MKNTILLYSLLISLLSSNQQFANVVSLHIKDAQVTNNNSPITRAEIETKLGRKMNFKERIAWIFVKKQVNKNASKETNQASAVGVLFILLGFLSFVIGLANSANKPLQPNQDSDFLVILGLILLLVGIIFLIGSLVQSINKPKKIKNRV